MQHVVWHASWRRHPARCDQAREEDIAQALVAPSREVYTTASRLSKMPTCTMTYTQDSHANPNEQLKTKLPPVPDVDDRRYCRACECTLPLAAFPSGARRFLCKRHIWQRIQQPSKRRTLANNKHKKLLWTMWKKCWTDARKTFKRERILLLQRDIEQTLAQLEDSSNDGCQDASCPGLTRDSTADAQPTSDPKQATAAPGAQPTSDRNPATADAQRTSDRNPATADAQRTSDGNPATADAQPTSDPNHATAGPDVQTTAQKHRELGIALMPSNPQHPLSRDNVVVVDKNARRVLLRAFRLGGADKYISELGAMD